jgi:DNA-directed RNA polymerase subunit RPC12/RpoP
MAEMKFECPHCQQHIQADDGYAGMQINCPACNGALMVPGSLPAPAPAAAPPPALSAQPPVPSRLSIRVTTPASAPAEAPAAPAPQTGSTAGACPSCGSALPRGAVLCTHCGYNLVTRQRTVAGKPAALGRPKAPSGEAPWYLTPWPYVGVVVLLLGTFYLLGRSHPPMMLAFVGLTVLYVLTTHILVLVAAFRESVGTGFLSLCIPFYALYFVFKVSESDTLKVLYGCAILLNIALRVVGAMAE